MAAAQISTMTIPPPYAIQNPGQPIASGSGGGGTPGGGEEVLQEEEDPQEEAPQEEDNHLHSKPKRHNLYPNKPDHDMN